MSEIIDISVGLEEDMPAWPGSIGFNIISTSKLSSKGTSNNSKIECDVHTGTHIDAPSHFIESGKTVEQINLQKLLGLAQVIDLSGVDKIDGQLLEKQDIQPTINKLIIRTDNSNLWANKELNFKENYVALTSDAAQWIVDHNIELVGIDYLSIQRFKDSNLTHEILLQAETVIVEGLNLNGVDEGEYELICLPLKLVGSDGSPARVILRKSHN